MECSLCCEHTVRGTWSLPESKLHISYLELKAVFLALKVSKTSDNTTVVSYGRRHEVRLTVCPSVEDPDQVFQETGDFQSLTHSRPAECGSRQTVQARPEHPDKLVSAPRGLTIDMHQVALTSDLFETRFKTN